MATVTRNFETLDVSTIDGGSAAVVTDLGQFSEQILLATFEGCHCWVQGDFVQSPTDDLVVEVYASPHDEAVNLDTIPLFSFTITAAAGEKSLSFIVTSVYSFKVKFKSSGSTDSINVSFVYRRWNWVTT